MCKLCMDTERMDVAFSGNNVHCEICRPVSGLIVVGEVCLCIVANPESNSFGLRTLIQLFTKCLH